MLMSWILFDFLVLVFSFSIEFEHMVGHKKVYIYMNDHVRDQVQLRSAGTQ